MGFDRLFVLPFERRSIPFAEHHPTHEEQPAKNYQRDKNPDRDGASAGGRAFALPPLNFVDLRVRFGRKTAMGPHVDKREVCRFAIFSPGLLPSGLIRCPCALTSVGVRIIIAAMLCAQNLDHVWLVIAAHGTGYRGVAAL